MLNDSTLKATVRSGAKLKKTGSPFGELITTLNEDKEVVILDYKDDEIEFKQIDNPDHYIRTPYSYESNLGKTYSPEKHIDLGQGLLQLIEEVKKNNS